jgi:hypothetical protein
VGELQVGCTSVSSGGNSRPEPHPSGHGGGSILLNLHICYILYLFVALQYSLTSSHLWICIQILKGPLIFGYVFKF